MNYCKIYIDSNADKAAMDSLLDEGVALFLAVASLSATCSEMKSIFQMQHQNR